MMIHRFVIFCWGVRVTPEHPQSTNIHSPWTMIILLLVSVDLQFCYPFFQMFEASSTSSWNVWKADWKSRLPWWQSCRTFSAGCRKWKWNTPRVWKNWSKIQSCGIGRKNKSRSSIINKSRSITVNPQKDCSSDHLWNTSGNFAFCFASTRK